MKSVFILFASFCLLLSGVTPVKAGTLGKRSINWESSIINIEVTRKHFDYQQPWARRTRTLIKSGVITGPLELLTTADELSDNTLIRLQKGGSGRWWNAKISWIDYHANLALLLPEEVDFWRGSKPVELAGSLLNKENLHSVSWKNANLDARKVEFGQYAVDDAHLSFVNVTQLELDSGQNSSVWPEVLVSDNKVAGLTTSMTSTSTRALPSLFIRSVLTEIRKGKWRGLGYFPFVWQQTDNTATHKFLNLPGEPRGVVVTDVPEGKATGENLKPRDIILEVDGFKLDVQGYYKDPDYGQLLLEALSTRLKFAGDVLDIKVWRNSQQETVRYTLPKAEYSDRLVPDQVFDHDPEYLIMGGLVFQPLDEPFLRNWGADWRRTAPFRLNYYTSEAATAKRPSLVVLSSVLPDSYNMGYQELRNIVVENVNGKKIFQLSELRDALKTPINGYHVIEFVRSDSLHRLVLNASEEISATQRVLQRYTIPQVQHIVPRK